MAPAVSGCVVKGPEDEGSDLDLLVDAPPGHRCLVWRVRKWKLKRYSG